MAPAGVVVWLSPWPSPTYQREGDPTVNIAYARRKVSHRSTPRWLSLLHCCQHPPRTKTVATTTRAGETWAWVDLPPRLCLRRQLAGRTAGTPERSSPPRSSVAAATPLPPTSLGQSPPLPAGPGELCHRCRRPMGPGGTWEPSSSVWRNMSSRQPPPPPSPCLGLEGPDSGSSEKGELLLLPPHVKTASLTGRIRRIWPVGC